MSYLWIVLSAAVASLAVGYPAMRGLARAGVVDVPNQRSCHQRPTVRGGGVGIILVVLGGLGWGWMVEPGVGWACVAAATLGLAWVSFRDDIKSVGAAWRFGCHAGCAGLVLVSLGLPEAGLAGVGGPGWWLGVGVVGFLWIAGYTNAFNFMDGINGLAAGQAVVTGVGMAAVGWAAGLGVTHPAMILSLVVAGAAAGFLPYNFPRAKMFMGDVGSAPLGFLLATVAWWMAVEEGVWLLIPLGLLHANFVLDTGVTLVRRKLRGDRLTEAHREHFYQRLIRAGRSHRRVTLTEWACQVAGGVALVAGVKAGAVGVGLAAVGVVGLWAVFFLYAERAFRAAGAPGETRRK